MKKFVGIPSEKTAEITEVRSSSSAWPDTAICLRAQLVATRDVLSFCGFLLLSAQASCTWRQLNGDFFCCVVFEQAVDAVMNTFTAEYDAAAAQLSLSDAKEQAGAETSGLQARPVPAAPGPAPTSPTAPPVIVANELAAEGRSEDGQLGRASRRVAYEKGRSQEELEAALV